MKEVIGKSTPVQVGVPMLRRAIGRAIMRYRFWFVLSARILEGQINTSVNKAQRNDAKRLNLGTCALVSMHSTELNPVFCSFLLHDEGARSHDDNDDEEEMVMSIIIFMSGGSSQS